MENSILNFRVHLHLSNIYQRVQVDLFIPLFCFYRRLNEDHENIVVPSGHKIHSLAVSSFEVRFSVGSKTN